MVYSAMILCRMSNLFLLWHCNVSGATPGPKAGADLLMDILSIGTPSPAQNNTSSVDLLSTPGINKNPSNALDTLSSPALPHIATTASAGGMFDLLDGLTPSPSKEGKKKSM